MSSSAAAAAEPRVILLSPGEFLPSDVLKQCRLLWKQLHSHQRAANIASTISQEEQTMVINSLEGVLKAASSDPIVAKLRTVVSEVSN